ncbi:MAG: two pore domain potassium channel family protein [Rhodospirillales bacterium]|nr:two pore domain potassium channel family protein [Rhodospirillales bacterium]
MYDHLGGYGIRVFPFVRLTICLLLACTLWNHFAWNWYGMHNSSKAAVTHSPILSFYYTIITMTTLGFGDFTPTTSHGMLAASCQSLFGIVWLGLLVSIIIKRVSK